MRTVSVAITSDGALLVTDGRTGIRRGRPDGSFEYSWWLRDGRDPTWGIGGLDLAGDGSLFVSMAETQQIHHYDRNGRFLGAWPIAAVDTPVFLAASMAASRSSESSVAARLASPAGYGGLDIDDTGRICAVQVTAGQVLCYSKEGRIRDRVGAPGIRGGRWAWSAFTWVGDVEVGADGTLWVTEPWEGRATGVRPDGSVLALGTAGDEASRLEMPNGLAVAEDGSVIVSDEGRGRLLRFAPDGRFMHAIGADDGGPGALEAPEGLTAHDGVVDVADRRAGLVQRYTVDGNWLGSWGSGSVQPRDVAIARDGRAYVSTWAGIDVYEAPGDRDWAVAVTGERGFEEAEAVWRTSTADVGLPGLTPPFADLLTDSVWRFRKRLRRDAEDAPVMRFRIEARGRLSVRANDREILYADPDTSGHATYEGPVPIGDEGTLFEVAYAAGEMAEAFDLTWLPWAVEDRAFLPTLLR